jgi:murein DD-endopeptidase MepM/ murein hydrolase activator NlpD
MNLFVITLLSQGLHITSYLLNVLVVAAERSSASRQGGTSVRSNIDFAMKRLILILLIFVFNLRAWCFEIRLSTTVPTQGDTLAVEIKGVERGSKCSCWFNAREYPVHSTDRGSLRTLIGLPYNFVPGRYAVLILEKAGGKKIMREYELLTVNRKVFPVSYVKFSPEKMKFIGSPLNERERDLITSALKIEKKKQNWQGEFILPVEGMIVGEYGVKRMVGRQFLGSHKGVDLKVPEDTPVRAANSGEVILAEEGFYLHGKTVMIDHGQGVTTIYLHLKSVNVTKLDKVTKGQIIGRVGETGLATGPHLHWGLYIHGVPVDPLPWVEREY